MNVTRKWERVVAVGCSHGECLAGDMRAAVLGFIDRYQPKHRLHLGDAMDTAAFRGGAKGTADEGEAVAPDLDAGLAFLRDMRVTVYCLGNHEDRIYRLRDSPSAIVADCARRIVRDIEAEAKRLRCTLVPWHIKTGWHSLGGVLWSHGYFFGENYLRDSAEAFGNCVVAHGHRAGHAHGRRRDGAQCWGTGTLAEVAQMDYAKARRSTLAWSAAVVYGEVTQDGGNALWVAEIGPDRRMPA
jgi:hypothetical protein